MEHGAERPRRQGRRGIAGVLLALVALAAVMVGRTLLVRPRAVVVPPVEALELEPLSLSRRLAGALRIPTVSSAEPDERERERVEEMVRYLREGFARAHAALELERPSEASLLYTWRGRDPSLAPLLLLAHLDVVPVDPATEGEWRKPPFSGELADGFVYGRGALDDKGSAIAILEAIEHQLRRAFVPRRTVLVAFGFDEEVGGARGAKAIAALLEERGVVPELVLDEGLFVLEGFIDGIERSIAAIGVAEKGSARIGLVAKGAGGHSSMPPEHTAVGRVARAVARLEARPMDAALDPPASDFFARLLPDFAFGRRLALANTWLTAPLVERSLAREPGTNALLRTTAAATWIEGGVAVNALPLSARAVLSYRVHPRDSVQAVLEHVIRTVDDPEVAVELLDGSEPSPISPARGAAYELLERTALQVFPDARVAPALCIAATDARHYARLTPHVYRFLPARLTPGEAAGLHGVNERIALSSYLEMVRFYVQLLANL